MSPRVMIAAESEALLLDVYLNGFASGFASALVGVGASVAMADRASDAACEAIRADPLAREAMLHEIAETLGGVDSGPHDLTVPIRRRPGRVG